MRAERAPENRTASRILSCERALRRFAHHIGFDHGAVVAEGAVVENSVLARNARVEAGAIVADGVIGDDAVVGELCELRGGIRVWPGVVLPARGVRFSPDV